MAIELTQILPDGFRVNTCGTCDACCTVKAVAEINKPEYSPCGSLNRLQPGAKADAAGCGCYADRPKSCSEYVCLWRHIPEMQEQYPEARPDRCGVVFDSAGGPGTPWPEGFIVGREVYPGAAEKLKARRVIDIVVRSGGIVLIKTRKEKGTGIVPGGTVVYGPPEKARKFARLVADVSGKVPDSVKRLY